MDRVVVISSDCHAGIPLADYRQYLERRYHSDFDDYDSTLSAWEVDAKPFSPTVIEDREEVARRSNFTDSQGRLRDLEDNGVVAEVMFPGASPGTSAPWSDFLSATVFRARTPRTRELQWAGERAYNRWLAEFCTDTPGRRVGLAFLPFHDVDASVAEIHWAAENGLNGIILPSFHYDVPEYVHGWYWDPIWAACEETGFSLNAHGGNGLPALGDHAMLMFMEVPFFAQRPLGHLIASGVFDRFPGLHFAVTESSASWVPTYLQMLDFSYNEFKNAQSHRALVLEDTNLPDRLPSEYWTTNGFVGVSLVKLSEMEERDRIGVETMMYGVDYPHPEGTWGQATTWVQASLGKAGASEKEARMMLGENAARCYHLDMDVLIPVAEKVGPTVAEVLGSPTDAELAALIDEANATGRTLAARHYENKSVL